MAVSLEVRAPFLDHRIADVAKLPIEYKLKLRTGKAVLRKAMQGLLPSEILSRPKKGFGMPIAQWLNGNLKELADEFLSPQRLRSQGFFDEEFVQKLISDLKDEVKS